MPSLLNIMMADKVAALLDDEMLASYGPEVARFYPRETALAIIHAAIWGHSARESSDAGAYAAMAMFKALGLKGWTFDQEEADELRQIRIAKAKAKHAARDAAAPTEAGGEGEGDGNG